MHEDAKKQYEALFDTAEAKAAAFDKIAEKYYFTNFGSTSKADFDVLMFSLYIEKILDKTQNDYSTYSDYRLSKLLGITQSKVSNLKVKKELLYPYEKFNWKESFLLISNQATYEDEKIKLNVHDKNLYLEIKNAIETAGGFVEVQLTPNLLQVRLAYFLDLMLSLSDDKDRDELRKTLKEKIKKDSGDMDFIEGQSLGETLINTSTDAVINIISECIPMFGGLVGDIAKTLVGVIKKKISNRIK